jgi:serine/threonine-protein kinase
MVQMVGPYEIIREIAQGGMADVFEARHAILGRHVALKVLREERTADSGPERMTQEAQILEVLSHTGTVRVFDVGAMPDRRVWIAMELVHGESLADRLARVGKLSIRSVMSILHDVLDVLHAAHAHTIVHRDLKPENLIIDDHGKVRVLDWGIAGIGGQRDQLARADMQPGTPHYMAPEQARGDALDTRTDIYALGVVLYEALTGVAPFDSEDDMEILVQHLTTRPAAVGTRRPDCPTGLARMVDQMLAKDADGRPTLAELRAGLAELEAALRRYEPVTELDDEATTNVEIELDLDSIVPLDDEVVLLEPDGGSAAFPRWTPEVDELHRESERGIAPVVPAT